MMKQQNMTMTKYMTMTKKEKIMKKNMLKNGIR